MRTVDFHALSRVEQDHFVDAVAGASPPAAIVSAVGGPRGHRVGWIVALSSALGLLLLWQRGYGDLSSDAVVHGPGAGAIWVLLVALVVGGALHALAGAWQVRALPWKAGIYVFPTALIDARTRLLKVYAIDDLERMDGAAGTLTLVFGGARFSFAVEPDRVDAIKREIETAQATGPASDPKVRASRDPLAEPRVSNPLAPKEPRTHDVPAWVRLRFALAGVAALAVGAGLWQVRNVGSDERAFADAKAKNDVAAYQDYLRRGARHRDEVARVLLPRAELEIAKKEGTVDAVLAYRKAHPSSAIQKEVDEALRNALLSELDVAKKEGTLAALDAFVKKRPEHGLDPELKAARHAVYQDALAKFKKQANEKDPQVVAFFDRLLAHAEAKNSPKVEVRMRHQASQSLPRADKYVTKHPLFNGETSYPTRYFDAAKVAPHATTLGKALVERLSSAFPSEILTFTLGAPVDDVPDLPTPTVPTLFVTHHVEWTGTAYPSQKPRGIFVGIQWIFHASFAIPADPKRFEVKATLPRPVPLNVLKDFAKIIPAAGDPEKAAYDAMTKEGFDQFAAKWVASVFKTAPEPAKKK